MKQKRTLYLTPSMRFLYNFNSYVPIFFKCLPFYSMNNIFLLRQQGPGFFNNNHLDKNADLCDDLCRRLMFRFAIVTLDGSVLLVDDDGTKKPVDSIMWNLQVFYLYYDISIAMDSRRAHLIDYLL